MAKWLIFASLLSAAASIGTQGAAATLTVADLAPNDLMISEYLANPVGVADADGEYFEIFNATTGPVDLTGLIVRDDGSNSFTIASLMLASLDFAVLASTDGALLGFTADYVYGTGMALTNTDDEIGLYRPDGVLIHKLIYDDGDAFGAGIAHELRILDPDTPTIVRGPTSGSDFIAADGMLPFDNFGSPGFAGNTQVGYAAVPLPAGIWLLASGLGACAWARRRAGRRLRVRAS